jgi:hypothetical protein
MKQSKKGPHLRSLRGWIRSDFYQSSSASSANMIAISLAFAEIHNNTLSTVELNLEQLK